MRRTLLIGLVATLAALPLGATAAPGGNGKGGDSAPAPTGSYADDSCATAPATWASDRCAGRQWGIVNVRAPQAWPKTTGTGVTVAVVDTGVDFAHPDLAANLVAVPGSDMLRNTAYVCPFQKAGRKARSSSALAQDDNGHGTHVAGTIAAVTNNGVGVAGVAPGARVLPVKVLDAAGEGSETDVARGICFAADKGAQVINLSLGFDVVGTIVVTGLGSEIDAAIDYAVGKGAAVIAAAGNDGVPICEYPAGSSKVLCVGAVDRGDRKAWYSSFGEQLGVVAPGGIGSVICDDDEDIWSTVWPGSPDACDDDGYETFAGTSMAAPHVSGVAALVRAAFPSLSPTGVYERLKATADPLGGPKPNLVYGYGRVNACRAVGACL